MTPDQLEATARKLCEIRGIDPDSLVSTSPPPTTHGYMPAVLLTIPAWRIAADEVNAMYQVVRALDVVMGDDFK